MGTRGASSAEHFLRAGYAVIFFHREESLKPFSRKFVNLFADIEVIDGKAICTAPGITEAVTEQHKYKDDLCMVPFVTIDDYLHLLEKLCALLANHGRLALLYLAAAVSDFYISQDKMPTHKIQSSDGDLNLSLSVVPKKLGSVISSLVPEAFTISFKLETDESILIKKARGALEKYGHELVIGNVLQMRKRKVVFVELAAAEPIELSDNEVNAGVEIETRIVEELVKKHSVFIENH
ncbi:unnamed protein product, partial [Mesorhabditis belari]|uniref:DNA/pantothenate metabolism flavoprotein C-terminal domain-containing protein n=1 Tax=Mesorhabditis belari TaxID=2138241 RepID=A0AAF3E971_9BILA